MAFDLSFVFTPFVVSTIKCHLTIGNCTSFANTHVVDEAKEDTSNGKKLPLLKFVRLLAFSYLSINGADVKQHILLCIRFQV